MNQNEPVAFTVAVTVDQDKASSIDVMTEPRVGSTVLKRLHDMLVGSRGDFPSGTYTLTYTVEDGCRVEGVNARAGEKMKRLLSEDLSELTVELGDVMALLAIDDDRLAEPTARAYAAATFEILQAVPESTVAAGFADIHIGCPECGMQSYVLAKELLALRAFVPKNDEEKTAVAERIARLEAERLPTVGTLSMFISGENCRRPFAEFANTRLTSRYRELTPRIERRAIELMREGLDTGTSRLREKLAALG